MLAKEVMRWRDSFSAKYGSANISIYSPDNFSLEKLGNDLFGNGLFAEKKLILLYGLPDDTASTNKISAGLTGDIAVVLEKKRQDINPDCIVIFISYKPDKRKKLYKFLSSHVMKEQKFAPLTGKRLLAYVLETFSCLDESLATYVLQRVGTNLSRIHQEMDKLMTYAEVSGETISQAMIDLVVW